MELSTSNGLCRCCLSEGSFKRLSHEYRWLGQREVYADMLQECFSFSVSDGDESNRLICEVCITRLRDAFNFKKQVLASDFRLRCGLHRSGDGDILTLTVETDAGRENKSAAPEVKLESPDEDDGSIGAEDADDHEMPIKFEETKVEFLDEEEEPLILLSRAKKATKRKAEPALERGKRRSAPAPTKAKVVLAPAKKMLKITTARKTAKKTEPSTSKEPVKKDESAIKSTFKLINNVISVLKNSTAMPFRWQRNRFKCFFCPASIADQTALRRHVDQEHSGANLDIAVKHNVRAMRATNVKIDVSAISCKICSQRIPSFDTLVQHLVDTHRVNYDKSVVGCILPFNLTELNCFTCNERFEFFSTLLLHVNRHVADCICEMCGSSFVTYRAMHKHRLKAHNDHCGDEEITLAATKPSATKSQFKCKTCGGWFPSEYRRRSHMASAHNVKYDFKCPHCEKEFQNQSTVAKHVKQTHLKERNFACEVCGDRFFDKQHVKLHMVRHYSEKVFTCEMCKKAFARKKTLLTHVRTHSNERRYQ